MNQFHDSMTDFEEEASQRNMFWRKGHGKEWKAVPEQIEAWRADFQNFPMATICFV